MACGEGAGWDHLLSGGHMEFRGQDTNTQEEAGNFKHIHLWLRNSILVDRMRGQEMVAEAWIHSVSLCRMDESLSWGREIWRWPALNKGCGVCGREQG